MNNKTLAILEYPKILENLAQHCRFSLAGDFARQLRPLTSLKRIEKALHLTEEAGRFLLSYDANLGEARDIRHLASMAERGGILSPEDLLNIKITLSLSRDVSALLSRHAAEFPRLQQAASELPAGKGLIQKIGAAISEKGDILDKASPDLGVLRQKAKTAQQRLMRHLQHYLNDSHLASMLQDVLITQRDGRYVIPVKAQFKGQIKGLIHDQSASGATVFIEPLPVVALNNALREAQLAVRDEERRILAALTQEIAQHAAALIRGTEKLAELDLIFAKARYAETLKARRPEMISLDASLPKDAPRFALRDARHPLLDGESAIPNDIILPAEARALVITGPNTGGKTVTLKTVGLLALMAQSGLFIPAAADSRLPVFRRIDADIGDEQSIEQSLSTFSGHIRNIVQILKKADDGSLVILDELGAGTDPQEGAALARAILSYLLEQGAYTFVATHYPELKVFAHASPGVLNASLEFNVQTLRPTYRLTIGLPGRSNALAIARRLGVPEEVLDRAAEHIAPESLKVDDLLDEIQRQRKLAHKERRRAERKHAEVHKMRRQLRERLEKIEDERVAILEKAQAEAEREMAALKDEIRALRREIGGLRRPQNQPADLAPLEKHLKQLEKQVKKEIRTAARPREALNARPLQIGDKVTVRSLGVEGVIQAIDGDEAELQTGMMRMRVRLGDLRYKSRPDAPRRGEASPSSAEIVHATPSPGMALDVRGQTVEEALESLSDYLEKAYLAGLPFVRVIHGKGSGALRTAIQDWLPQHPHVASFEKGLPNEGGLGVTIVKLKN